MLFLSRESTSNNTGFKGQRVKNGPISLGAYKIRYERAADATAGDLKYHSSCWRDIIFKRVKDFDLLKQGTSSSNKTLRMDDVDTINLLDTGDKMGSLQQTETTSNN